VLGRTCDRASRMRKLAMWIGTRARGVVFLLILAAAALAVLYPRPSHLGKGWGVTEIVYWMPTTAGDSMRVAIEEFERRHPEYHVVAGSATAQDETGDPTRFLLGVAGGVPPDLIYFDRFAIVEWASRGAFLDLGPWINRDRNLPDGIRQEDIYRPAWLEPIYKGHNYAIANSLDTRAMYYNGDPLIRAGFVYTDADREVSENRARPGDARPPKTWEEICRKLVHAEGSASADGVVRVVRYVRRPAVNEGIPKASVPNLALAGVRPGDVVALVAGTDVFRRRIKSLLGPRGFRIDLVREQRRGLKSVPFAFRSRCEVKIFSQDGCSARLTRFDPETGRITSAAFIPFFGNSWLYMYGWLNGAEFMTADGSRCRLDSPEIIAALQWIVDVYDSMGGYKAASVFQQSAQSGALDPFLTGDVAMRIDGDWLMHIAMLYKPDLNFGVVPSPIPEKRLKAGFGSVGWSGGWAYAIPSTARHKEGAWKLLRWLSSVEANKLMLEYDASVSRAKGQTYFPSLQANVKLMAWAKAKYVTGNPAVSAKFARGYEQFVELLPASKYRPVTPVGQKLWQEHVRAAEAACNHVKTPYAALNYGKRQVQTALDRVLHPPTGPIVKWRDVIAAYLVLIVLCAIGLGIAHRRRRRLRGPRRREWIDGLICASPWLVGLLAFGAGPIVFSIIISFCHYDVLNPARFVGLSNYVSLLGTHYDSVVGSRVTNDPLFWKSLANTGFMLIGIPLGIAAGLGLAMLLDTKVRGLHLYRTVYYLPAIVPAVAAFILWIWIFDPGRGMLSQVLRYIGVRDPPLWLQDPVWAKPSLILMGLWGVGGSMIIWLAGLKDIPESLYEAARIDGASRLYCFRHITLPLLTPYIFFQLIMGMIGAFQIFEAAFIMTQGGPGDSTLFYAYKLFNEAFRFLNMGAASAMAWILFVVVLALTLSQLWLGKKWVYYSG
jgi:ABC-type sugar transport system permease subunit/ABC-type glycerol-3-phosphate transport system substrate-binding protein